MKKKLIDRFSIRYIISRTYIMTGHRFFYRKMQSKFNSRIPKDRPVLIAPNHQNALMDAMANVRTSGRDLVFLTRADVFNNRFIAALFRIYKMLPVYRMRDGASELSKNEDIFNESMQVLLRKICPVVIYVEGNHGDKRRLRPLVKGIFRIAFQAQESYGEKPGVVIVPCGIDYSNYTNFRSKLFVQYGEPIEVSEYYAEFKENSARAINKLRARLSEEMKKYIIHIPSEEHYDTYMLLRQTYNQRMRERLGFSKKDLHHRLLADQHMIRELSKVEEAHPEKMPPLTELAKEYQTGVKKLGLRDWIFRKNRHSLLALILADLGLLIMLPVYLYGVITHILIYMTCQKVGSNIKDSQFQSTVKFLLGLILFTIWYPILFVLAWVFTDPGWIKWAFLASLPLSGLLAHTWFIWFKKMRSLWRYQFMTLAKNKRLARLKELRKQIIEITESLISDKSHT